MGDAMRKLEGRCDTARHRAIYIALSSHGKPLTIIAQSARNRQPQLTMVETLDLLGELVEDKYAQQSTNDEGPIGWRLKQ